MIATVEWIKKTYEGFNDLLWDGKLPHNLKFSINNSRKTWGYASYRFNTWEGWVKATEITVSNFFDSPEEVKTGVLIHEMIHIADYSFHPEHFIRNGRKVSGREYDAHGYRFFLPEMNRVNQILKEYGYNITVSPNVTAAEQAASSLSDRQQEILKSKKQGGMHVFIGHLAKYDPNGEWLRAYVQNSSYNKWIERLEGEWYRNEYDRIDDYITYDDSLLMKKSTKAGLFYFFSHPSEKTKNEYIEKHGLKFNKNIWNAKDDEIDTEYIKSSLKNPIPDPGPTDPDIFNNEHEEKPSQIVTKRISLFRFPIVRNGMPTGENFEVSNVTREELKEKMKIRFPKWSDEAIERALNNAKYYPKGMNEVKNDKGTAVPKKCDKCGGDVVLQIHGEPVYLCNKCKKYFGTMPFPKDLDEETIFDEVVKESVCETLGVETMGDSSKIPGCRRSKIKQISANEFEESIE